MREEKAVAYGEVERYAQRLPLLIEELPDIIDGKEFQEQMRRFLPLDVFERTVANPDFRELMASGILKLYL